MKQDLRARYGEKIIDAIELLITNEFDELMRRGWIFDFSRPFLESSAGEVDRTLFIIPDLHGIMFAELNAFEDGRGHQIIVEIPLREQVNGDMDAMIATFEIPNDGSFLLTSAGWRNYALYRAHHSHDKLN